MIGRILEYFNIINMIEEIKTSIEDRIDKQMVQEEESFDS